MANPAKKEQLKTHSYHWEHPDLFPFTVRLPEGEYLFRQGDVGDEVFIVIQGLIQIIAEDRGKERSLSLVKAGEFVGEQALMNFSGYKRAFTARAKTNTTALKLGSKELEALQKKSPGLANEVLWGILRTAATRLQRSNQVIRLLRSSNNVERLVNLILYFGEVASRPSEGGKEVVLSREGIRFYIDMSDFEIEECLTHLEKEGHLVRKAEDIYLIKDEKALRGSVRSLRDNLPNITII